MPPVSWALRVFFFVSFVSLNRSTLSQNKYSENFHSQGVSGDISQANIHTYIRKG